ncbi:LysR family transcriptional regulator [Bifidobacterium oedipodis]|uniref:LysR family transcriptional regulator n=1 Tax=Bifidobacterium oedipodis TaxID=2675322 RepID=A0A7Y0HTQ7_9BIFI|nr:LysR family transcriptional regulator [Bifidobacterium sp. DSM 109957]NMM94833.1 LysR family transcriptional regulator [Bifidobacterium sp. DSM 109957]
MLDQAVNVFLQVAQCGSFTKAAEQLYVTSTAVMNQINRLERHLSVKLFNRSPSGVILTEAGEIYRQGAQQLVDLDRELCERTRHAATRTFTLRIGDSLFSRCDKLPHIWSSYLAEHPQSEMHNRYVLQIIPFRDGDNINGTAPEGLGVDFDMVMGHFDQHALAGRYRFQQFSSTPCCLLVPRSHPLFGRSSAHISELSGQRLAIPQNSRFTVSGEIQAWLRERYPDIILEFVPYRNDLAVFNQCSLQGTAMLGLDYWNEIYPAMAPVLLNWDFCIPHGMAWAASAPPEVHRFAELICAQVNEYRTRHPDMPTPPIPD